MKKRILAINIRSSYDVLSIFKLEMYQEFEAKGYIVDECKTLKDLKDLKDLLAKPFHEYEFIFSINSALLEEIAFYIPATMPAVAYVVDHPIEQDVRLRNACLSYLALHVGQYRVQYADKLYKNINKNFLVPHGGSKGNIDIPFANRSYDVVFFGGYESPNKIMQDIHNLPGNLSAYNIRLVNILVSDETISWGDAIEQVCSENNLKLNNLQLSELGRNTFLADKFFRMYTRDLLIRYTIEAGIHVHVFGNGWENYECKDDDFLHIHKSVNYAKALDIMGDSKIVLNITPTLNAGSHERIFSAMINGAICFTNYSSYIQQNDLQEKVVTYSIHDMKNIPHMIQLILDNPDAAKEISKNAQKCALEKHTWANRARDIILFIETYKKEMNYNKNYYNNSDEMQFHELCRFINQNTFELLLEKMKCMVHLFLEDNNGRMARALQSYNNYGYWGSCLSKEDDYKLLENRANALKNHLDDFIWMWEHLEDEKSKVVIYSIMRHWLDYAPMHLSRIKEIVYEQYFDHDIISCNEEEVFVDLGSYTGDTVLSYIKNFEQYRKIYCYDIDEENLNVCKKNLRIFDNIEFHQKAVGEKSGYIYVEEKTDTSANSISQDGEKRIPMVCLDEDILEPITFLKMDIEGSEQMALLGAKQHIINDHPKLAISIYHNNEDIWKIGKMIHDIDSSYRFYIRYYGGTLYPSEYILYAV